MLCCGGGGVGGDVGSWLRMARMGEVEAGGHTADGTNRGHRYRAEPSSFFIDAFCVVGHQFLVA